MVSLATVKVQWKDEFLKWKDCGFLESVTHIRAKQEDIWLPDVTVLNVVESKWHLG